MRRVKISSKKSSVRVSLKLPTIDANKDYRLTVERFEVPHLESRNFSQHLFTIRRKMTSNVAFPVTSDHLFLGCDAAGNRSQPQYGVPSFTEFTANGIVSMSGLVQDMNRFIQHRVMLFANMADDLGPAPQYVNPLPADFQEHLVDNAAYGVLDVFDTRWFTTHRFGVPYRVRNAVCATIRTDGRVGFQFSDSGVKLFTIELTEAGKTLFGFSSPSLYVAGVAAGVEYDVVRGNVNDTTSNYIELPTISDNDYHIIVGDSSLFNTMRYSDEIVIRTSLPLHRSVHVHNNTTHYLRQLASYQLPATNPVISSSDYMRRKMEETFGHVHIFEEDVNTHNSFQLKGSTLQLFHIDLYIRELLPDGSFQEKPFPMDNEHYFTLQLVCAPF